MNKKIKHIINLIMAAVGMAMGVAATVLTIIDADFSILDLVRLLAIGVFALGLLALNNVSEDS